jgi:hypothetical protein
MIKIRNKKGRFVGNKMKSMSKEELRKYNKERTREHRRKLTKEKKEQINKKAKIYAKNHPEIHLKSLHNYRNKNPDRIKAYSYAEAHHFKGKKCRICGKRGNLHFHHIDYINYKNKNCGITLCEECHRKLHRNI